MNAQTPPEVESWLAGGRMVPSCGRSVFARVEGSGSATPILFLHGFPTSSFDLRPALPTLAKRRRVVVHDHPGFGLSEKPTDYSYSLFEQADAAIGVWRALGITRGHLVAHDYGTSVATELLARHRRGLLPISLASVTVCNGSMVLELAKLRVTQKLLRSRVGPLFARLASYRVFRAQMRRIFARADSVSERELELAWCLMQHNDGRAVTAKISGYLDERVRFRHRWIDELTGLNLPTHVLWARRDPIAVPAIAERVASLVPGAQLTWIDELGHYPMLEDPTRWASEVTKFIDAQPA